MAGCGGPGPSPAGRPDRPGLRLRASGDDPAPIAITLLGEDRVAVAGTPADCVRLALDHLTPERRLGPLRDQCRRQPRRGRLPFGDGRRRPGGGTPRHPGYRPVALHRPRPGHRLDPRGALGHEGPPAITGVAHATRHLLERQLPPPRAGRARPRRRLLPARPVALAPDLSRRGGPGRLHGQLPIARPDGRSATSTSASAVTSP